MCGIGGFSLSNNSKLNSRKIANVMLTALEDRGRQASGASWHSKSGVGYVKRNVAGSQLNLRSMPRKTDAVVLHTRYATHGSPNDNRNNHPVQSPDSTIHLVHNGVIYNHDIIRPELPHKLPAVDSSVIPALLQDEGLEGISKLDGDAAIAWLSDDYIGDLFFARIEHSPMVVCQVKDGSFFFASTEQIMLKVLDKLKLKPTFWLSMPERTGYVVRKGRIIETLLIPDIDPEYRTPVSVKSYDNYRWQTSGGKGGIVTSNTGYNWQTQTEGVWYAEESKSQVEIEFQDWLDENFLYTNGEYFTYDGFYVGSRKDLQQKWEDERYEDYWLQKEAEFLH